MGDMNNISNYVNECMSQATAISFGNVYLHSAETGSKLMEWYLFVFTSASAAVCLKWIFLVNRKYIFTLSIISQWWDGLERFYLPLWQAEWLLYRFNNMVADDLMTHVARSSLDLILRYFVQNTPVSHHYGVYKRPGSQNSISWISVTS